MSNVLALKEGNVDLDWQELDLTRANAELEKLDAEQRVAWTLDRFPGHTVLSSSFGAQSAVLLHMAARQRPDLPVVLIDTGYLFPETYGFVDELTDRLGLNLRVYRAGLSPAWQEARYGKLWEQGVEGIDKYNRMNKVEPMQRALDELDAHAWLSGIRRSQSQSRQERAFVENQNGRVKVHPILDWDDRDIYLYLRQYDLPYHPLWHEGYVSIGDWHTTQRLADGMDEEDTRFFGLKRECGLHEHA
ncbi:phosphoadenylyl-sulfate reductase [Ectothiorhodospiraceae bacterium WFHF3C12]|nr:phosphoadenylyl-sulfate reductase [Ectothiorhodospiraceae bacterium WFHF3C12]